MRKSCLRIYKIEINKLKFCTDKFILFDLLDNCANTIKFDSIKISFMLKGVSSCTLLLDLIKV